MTDVETRAARTFPLTTHIKHTTQCAQHPTPMCPKHRPPARPYPTPDKHTQYPTLGHSQPSLPNNFECFCPRREASSNKNLRQKRILRTTHRNTKIHTKKRPKSSHDETPKFKTYRYWKLNICQNGHLFWVRAHTTIKCNPRHHHRTQYQRQAYHNEDFETII